MTQVNERQQATPNDVSTLPRNVSKNPSTCLRPTSDSISDNDNSEKPVREKLKKTSLASMSSHISERPERALKANQEDTAPNHMHRDSSPEEEVNRKDVESRGRPVKKRSFDDLDTAEAEGNEAGRDHVAEPNANSHLRKRSRDVRMGETSKASMRPLLAETPVQEELEDATNGVETSEACISGSKTAVDSISPATETLSRVEKKQDKEPQDINEPVRSVIRSVQQDDATETEKESADLEMRDLATSPQKKRSRDLFDTEVDREQKIPATEEARAHRRSDELDRGEGSVARNRSSVSPENFDVAESEPVTVEEEEGLADVHVAVEKPGVGSLLDREEFSNAKLIQRPMKGAFGGASTSPSMAFAKSGGLSSATKVADQQSQPFADAFASSGFTALAASSTSPFGTLGGSSTSSPFASAGFFHPGRTKTDKRVAKKIETVASDGVGTFVNSSSGSLDTTDQLQLGTAGLSQTSVFRGSVFGSAFGGPFGVGNRLTSFAAPTGNAKFGASNGIIKPIGSPEHDREEDENSESDGGSSAENKKDEEAEEADGRFQHQDGRHISPSRRRQS